MAEVRYCSNEECENKLGNMNKSGICKNCSSEEKEEAKKHIKYCSGENCKNKLQCNNFSGYCKKCKKKQAKNRVKYCINKNCDNILGPNNTSGFCNVCKNKKEPLKICETCNKKIYKNTNHERCKFILNLYQNGKENIDYVICKECFNENKDFIEYIKISINSKHLLSNHNMTKEEYSKKYDVSIFITEKLRNILSDCTKKQIFYKESYIKANETKVKNGTNKHSENTKLKMSKSRKAFYENGGKTWHDGRTNVYSEESLEKMSKIKRGRIVTDVTKKKQSEYRKTLIGEKNSRYGQKHSNESKAKMSKTHCENIINGKYKKFKDTKGELQLKEYLKNLNIDYCHQYRIYDAENKKSRLFDFYLPKFNILIEVDGTYYHCKPGRYPNGPINIIQKEKIEIDKQKNKLAKRLNYKLVRVWDDEIDKVWRII